MEHTLTTSKLIKSVGYDAEARRLEVEFHSGKVYHYADVAPETHQAFITAESIGAHFGRHIKTKHACTPGEK